jgi:6,7-dimethyl-8-ribityllumazine synthase
MSDDGYTVDLERDAAAGWRFGVVVSRFNEDITSALLDGARTTLKEYGASSKDIEVVHVPGAFELPMGATVLAAREDIHAVVCVGALIRGETPHFDVLATSTAHAVQDVAREFGLPVTFGLITCDTMEQAQARAGGAKGNKGSEAALAAIEMIGVYSAAGE